MANQVVSTNLVVRGVPAYQAKMGAAARANTRFAGSAAPAAASARTMQTRMGAAGAGAGLMSAKFLGPAGVVVALGKAVSAGMDYERSLTKMETLVGLTSDEVETLSDGIMGLSDVTQGPQDLADAMFFVTSAGLRGAEALDTVEAAAKGADIGLGSVKDIADLATSAMNAYGTENLSAADATDILAGAVRAGKLESSEMASAMGRLLPTASAMDISFEDLAGTMAVMSRTGSNATESVTSIQAIMSTMLKPTKEAQDALEGVGLSMSDIRAAAEGPEGLVGAMRLLNDTFGGNDEALAQVIPNVRAFRGAMNVLAQDAGIVDGVLSDVANSTGLVGEAHDKHMQTAAGQWDLMKRNASTFATELGSRVLPALNFVLEDLNATFQEGSVGHFLLTGRSAAVSDLLGGSDDGGGWFDRFSLELDRLGNELFGDDFMPVGWFDRAAREIEDDLLPRTKEAHDNFWALREAAGGSERAMNLVAESADEAGTSLERLSEITSDYLDTVRATEDPVFRLDKAVRDLDQAQKNYDDTLEDTEASQADVQQAAMDLMGALSELEAAAIDGDLSFEDFDARLQHWVDRGAITANQADHIRERVALLTEGAEDYDGEYVAEMLIENLDVTLSELRDLGATADQIARARTLRFHMVTSGTAPVMGQMEAFADGGHPTPGKLALVGEEGPELVVFGAPSTVIPADQTAQIRAGAASVGGPGAAGASSRSVNVEQNFYGKVDPVTAFRSRDSIRSVATQVAYS